MTRLARPLALCTLLVSIPCVVLALSAQGEGSPTRSLDTVLALSRVHAAISRDVLMTQRGLLADYDPLVTEMRLAEELVDQLSAFDTAMAATLRDAFSRKAALLEQFKTANAVYRNSVAIFGTELRSLTARPPPGGEDVAEPVRRLGLEVLAYHASGAAEQLADARAALGRFEEGLRRRPVATPEAFVALRSSARNILARHHDQDTLARQVVFDELPALLADATARYLDEQRRGAALARGLRIGLAALASALLVGLAVALMLLDARHRALQGTLGELADEKRRVSFQKDALEQSLTRLREARSQLVRTERLATVGQLAAGVAHEINNPLAYVLSNLRYIRTELEPLLQGQGREAAAELRDAILESEEGGKRIQHIVRGLKAFSRVDEDTRAPLDVREVIDTSLRMADHEIRHRCRLVRDFGPVPLVEADKGRLGQVVLNLLLNAAQALDEVRGREHEIRVVTRTGDDGSAVIEVHDTGCGIPEEHRAQLFDPFFTTKPVGVGTGLGLSICDGIVGALGGAIEVSSTVGRGSVFLVRLPPAASAEAGALEPESAPQPRGGGRVVVVDDDVMVGRAIARRLARTHQVTAFQRAADALGALEGGLETDLILCDMMMPEMDGMEFCRRLQRMAPHLGSRVVLITGGAFTPGALAFVAEGGYEVLEKPLDEARLAQVIERRTQHRAA